MTAVPFRSRRPEGRRRVRRTRDPAELQLRAIREREVLRQIHEAFSRPAVGNPNVRTVYIDLSED